MAAKKTVTVKGYTIGDYTRKMPKKAAPKAAPKKAAPKKAARQSDLFGSSGRGERSPKLKFKLTGKKITPGCDYAVITWLTGESKKRRLVSCHRTVGAAQQALADFKARPMFKASSKRVGVGVIPGERTGQARAGVYNVYTGVRRT